MNIKWLKKKKGVSPVIAVVLMIAVAVAIAVIVYTWASGFTSEKTGAESAEAEQLVLEAQNCSGNTLTVYIRNALSTDSVIDTIYHNGVIEATGDGTVLQANSVTTYIVPGTYTSGDDVMIVTLEGTQIKFKAKDC